MNQRLGVLIFILFMVGACAQKLQQPVLIDGQHFAKEVDGKMVKLYTLKNTNGVISQVINYGCKVVNLWMPDKKGNFVDIVTGYNNIDDYLKSTEPYFGAIIGRYGNRIAKGQFTLNDTLYTLAVNNNENHLHGGIKGYNAIVWEAEQTDRQTIVFTHVSPDMDEGYPGELTMKVQYQLTDENELKIEYWATTTKSTPVNLTHHSFFNLKGENGGTINDHILQINADYYTPVDKRLIPTGEIAPTEGTPMDFRNPTTIGERVDADFEQLKFGMGYDHNWGLNQADEGLTLAAKVIEPTSGRTMEVYTNEPGIQFYGGNFLNGSEIGKSGVPYEHRTSFCLETQHYPDSPNKENFPSCILNPGEEYYSICVYKFGVEE